MRKFSRLDEPEILKNNWAKWGQEYERERSAGDRQTFKWHEGSYKQILLQLLKQTDEHCSYCDNAHLKRGDFTIDHFKPKSIPGNYNIAYKWDNLFFCCWHCQQAKGRQYSEYLLRPDAVDFEFSKYFSYNFTGHEILANDSASHEDQQKALETIRIFDLNHLGLIKARRFSFNLYEREKTDSAPVLSDYSYRFLFD